MYGSITTIHSDWATHQERLNDWYDAMVAIEGVTDLRRLGWDVRVRNVYDDGRVAQVGYDACNPSTGSSITFFVTTGA